VFTGAFALYWNPASLAQPGWELALDADLIIRQGSYDRDAILNLVPAELRAANTGRAMVSTAGLMIDLGLGLAVRHRRTGLSIGFTPILVVADFSTVRARNIDGSEDLVDASGNPKEGRAWFSGSGQAFSTEISRSRLEAWRRPGRRRP
jgi:hypothetical protein